MDNFEGLSGRAVAITGASSGAGRAAALEFAKYGTALALAGRNEKALREVAKECERAGSQAKVVVTDVSDPEAVLRLAKTLFQWKGRIDVWINNAGVLAAGEFDRTPMDVHRQVVETNLLGYMNGAHAVLPYFKKQGKGILINNISIGGYLPVPYGAGYTASKFGLRGFFEALRGELEDWPEIHVCDLFPAFLKTPGIEHAANYTGKVLRSAPPVYDPEDLARAMAAVALHPKSSTYPGKAALLFKSVHAVVPDLTTKVTGSVMRYYFRAAESTPVTSGNVFGTVSGNMAVYGRDGKHASSARKFMTAGLLGGLAVGLLVLYTKKVAR